MITAFTKMMKPMKESKKEEEIQACIVCRCLSNLHDTMKTIENKAFSWSYVALCS